jgi:hypothetical protein
MTFLFSGKDLKIKMIKKGQKRQNSSVLAGRSVIIYQYRSPAEAVQTRKKPGWTGTAFAESLIVPVTGPLIIPVSNGKKELIR